MERRLYEASVSGSVETLEALIREDQLILDRVSVTCFDETPLHVAALCGHVSFARAILSRAPKLATELDSLRRTPLHLASAKGHVEMVRELLLVNDDVCKARDEDGKTPLHLAVMKGRVEVIQELVRVRPNLVYEKVERGESVLHLCVKYNCLEALKMLVEYLSSNMEEFLINSKDDNDNNILHLAVALKQMETIEYLFGIPSVKELANMKNQNGCTTLDVLEHSLIRDLKSMEIREFLLQSGVRRAQELDNHYIQQNQQQLPSSSLIIKPPTPPSTTQTSSGDGCCLWKFCCLCKFCSWCWNIYVKVDHVWLRDVRGHLVTAATLTATMAYQAILSPPGGVWQDVSSNQTSNNQTSNNSPNKPGTSVLATNTSSFTVFLVSNTTSLIASLSTILLALSGFPLRNKFFLWLLILAMCNTVFCMVIAYMSILYVMFPQLGNTLSNIISFSVFCWLVLCALVIMLHTCRFFVWLCSIFVNLFKSCGRICRRRRRIPGNIENPSATSA